MKLEFRPKRSLKTLLLVLPMGALLSTQAQAVPCAAGEFLGTTTYITKKYTPTGAGGWDEGWISWWRSVKWKCTKETKKVEVCYRSWWDRFWAVNGTMKRVTNKVKNLKPRTTHETRYFCSDEPPATLPPVDEDITLGQLIGPDNPGSIVLAFASVAELMGDPGEGIDNVDQIGFEEIVAIYGERLIAGSEVFMELYQAGLAAQTSDVPIEPEMDDWVLKLAGETEMMGADLSGGAPSTSAPYANLASLFNELITWPSLRDQPNYAAGDMSLNDAVAALTRMAEGVETGLLEENAQAAFVDDLETLRQAYEGFALAFAEVEAAGGPDVEVINLDLEPGKGPFRFAR